MHEFEIVDLIGEGGFGIVYLARDAVLERKVALKEYLPAALAHRGPGMTVGVTVSRNNDIFQAGLRSFVNEARMLAQFDHPALVKVYRFWEANGTAYMVMPYYEGVTLKEALRRAAAPPNELRLKELLVYLLDALEVLHSANALHRDIAPDNILILASGAPVLLDFGAARRVITDRTQTLTVILKPGFAPVEQYAEAPSLKQGPWTDLYALAAVMHFAITGAAPVPAVARTIADPVVPLQQAAAGRYTVEFLRALDRALAVKPDDRPQSISDFRTELGLGSGPPSHTTARTVPSGQIAAPAARADRFRSAFVPVLVVVLVVGIAAAAVLVRGTRTSPTSATPIQPPTVQPTPRPPVAAPPPEAAAPTAIAPATPAAPDRSAGTTAPPPGAESGSAPVIVPSNPSSASLPRVKQAPKRGDVGDEAAALVAATLQDGEKCFAAKQYDCAIANANAALRFDPASAQAQRLKAAAIEAQQRALSGIKIE